MDPCSGAAHPGPPEPAVATPDTRVRCARCGRSVARGAAFAVGAGRRCLGCSLRYAPLLRRSALTALVVGTILVLINQGGVLLSGQLRPALAWQIPLTYLVPFCVATWGALSNTRGG